MSEHYFIVYTQPRDPLCTKAKCLIHEMGFAFIPIDISRFSENARKTFMEQFPMKERELPKIQFGGMWIKDFEALEAFFVSPEANAMLAPAVLPPILAEKLSDTAQELIRGSEEAIAFDLCADLGHRDGSTLTREALPLYPHKVVKVPTGWALRAPVGHYLRVAPRSGLSLRGVDTLAGVVDRDYTGEITVVLTNHSEEVHYVNHGDRIAQIIAERAAIVDIEVVSKLPGTGRGGNGYGSTGA